VSRGPDGSVLLGRSALLFRVALVAAVLGLMAWVYSSGLLEGLTTEQVRMDILALGPWGIVAYLVALSFLQPLHLSIYLFMGAAVLLWGPWLGGLICWIGTLGSAANTFAFARYVARDGVQKRLPDRFRAMDAKLEGGGLKAVILLRLVFFTTPALQLMFGVSRIDFRTYMLGTAIGNVPMLVLSIAVGTGLKEWLGF
jgi:uncharacterized membrane protein YdjX (TVP38/TMEM64 family)